MNGDLLDVLDADTRRAVVEAARRRSWRRGEALFHEQDPGDSLHLIRQGHLAIRVSTPSGDVATLAILGPGDSCGEQALVSGQHRRTASAYAVDAAETLVLQREVFDGVRASHPGVDRLLVEVLAAQVRRLSTQVVEALYVPAESRVLRRLADVAEQFAAGRPGPRSVPLTQEDLAAMAGTTRPTANKALRTAVEAGVVALGRGRAEVLDVEGLRHLAR
jgi:CRP/FNR family transcriptional regulator, cyclic AMP receptor protein